jgi:hypothetical protein
MRMNILCENDENKSQPLNEKYTVKIKTSHQNSHTPNSHPSSPPFEIFPHQDLAVFFINKGQSCFFLNWNLHDENL